MPIRRHDPAHAQTDKMLSEIERRIKVEYAQAEREIADKFKKYFDTNNENSAFNIKDKKWQKWVAEGKKDDKDYQKWRTGQLAMGKRWEEMRQTIAEDLHNTDKIAKSIAYGYMPDVYALNHDYGTFQVEKGSGYDTSYSLYSREAAERIFRDNPQMLPSPGKRVSQRIADGKAMRWNNQNVQSVMMQGILQGNNISDIATRLHNTVGGSFTEEDIRNRDRKTAEQIAEELTRKNRQAAIRNARTMVTAAQNGGRIDSYKRANQLGIKTRKQWLATLDHATRHAHRELDGERAEVDDPFVNEFGRIMYPGDPAAAPANVYNCRCTLIAAIKGHEIDSSDMSLRRNDKLKGMSYDDWKKEKQSTSRPILQQEEIGDAIRAGHIREYRGYGGDVPSGRDMTLGIDAMNEQATGGGVVNGKDISQTWQRRPEQFGFEIEDVINAQGFDGLPRIVSKDEFEKAVREANGGKGFVAQRTYSAPDKETLDAYRDQLYNGKWYVDCSTGGAQYGQGMYCAADYNGEITEGMKREMNHYRDQYISKYGYDLTEEEWLKNASSVLDRYNIDKTRYTEIARAYLDEDDRTFERLTNGLSGKKRDSLYDDLYEIPHRGIHNNVETFTLDPSARIITDRELNDIRNGNLIYQHKYTDNGSLAASLGYDAINVEGHGESGSYTVILNRTMVIFLGE